MSFQDKRSVARDFGAPYIGWTDVNKKIILLDAELDIQVNIATCVIGDFSMNYSIVPYIQDHQWIENTQMWNEASK